MQTLSTGEQILRHMALAFFGSAFADQADECDQSLSGEIMDQLPSEIDPAALHAANTLAMGLLNANPMKGDEWRAVPVAEALGYFYEIVDCVYETAEDKGDRDFTPEMFGHYCAMQAMGHGVGLERFGSEVGDYVTVPYVEFSSCALQRDYFTNESEEG
jgi:hypothetical protein